ncbi:MULTISPECIES: IDEAL domain-containing protein [Psychrobacillus]|uniref:IDEAL domain-containing protein n=1 Tax=Psychrobacillus faecigallinarum TaxID=2762235 RepID=A0ABR8RCW1_9BACI|nr:MULTISPECIES: IDEAL domain-containing protein [Psychrobacillus]MBD7945641.1 IDEAL domain-containing protein [Psychrobacillus faecigallinarum]QEY22388.1 IDEAL domain-containing protein [Psychrobacillus sp. AK 1817]QGM29274.1 IDEAL domain-containing protein [Bacillus sp. N3536]
MDKQYSYTDFMKAMGQTGKESSAEKLLNEIYLDMFLNVVHREQRSYRLLELIDEALDRKDRKAFNEYTNVLLQLKS